ncbi:helicase-related protein [Desulfamplus magnetovallimortis]|uniref:helicase-related protein n=1 Tax=Desulfamplus magnetovallimortis TaxID=1246637 RepID=UPI001C93F1BD|nr:helicase-related protein [Desulfamplus magnetovallimortis]
MKRKTNRFNVINRFSSIRESIADSLLNRSLTNAKSYDRIAGFFRSSIFEVAGEALESVSGKIRIVCNSELLAEDVRTAKLANASMRKEWCEGKPEELENAANRFKRLYEFLKSGKMQIRVLPNDKFGLIHGKAGVITLENGEKRSFLGSVNESKTAWKINYELAWEDDSEEAVNWVQEEFDSLWNDISARDLSDFIIEDIKRISERVEIDEVVKWKEEKSQAAAVAVESPVYREHLGLWEHQKYFVDLALRDHKKSFGARYILADQVGLGKTIQLAMGAQLMALYGDKPVLIIVPKTLIWQWQDEMNALLDLPSAGWDGRQWIDENGLKYPNRGRIDIVKCPRRIGIISQGLISLGSETAQYLLKREYECVIVDEAHRNPFIRHVVRRERSYLENKIDPITNEPYLQRINVELHGESEEEALILTGYMKDAYELAEDFCKLLGQRVKSAGFFRTLLLKRIGSSLEAGKRTGQKMLREWGDGFDEFSDEQDNEEETTDTKQIELKNLTAEEKELLNAFVAALESNQATDPKFLKTVELLKDGWKEKGVIIFSQYYDTAFWVADKLSSEFPSVAIALYAGGDKSGVFFNGYFKKEYKDTIKAGVKSHKYKILVGTDSASEGLNLQTLGTLINLDLPWNPTRLEQRKGRVQRIGQINDTVHIYNMRYKDSVEDRVHDLLSERLKNITSIFGQLPDVLEDVWIEVAKGEIEEARKIIDSVPDKNPFEVRYNQNVSNIDWASCSKVLNNREKRRYFKVSW